MGVEALFDEFDRLLQELCAGLNVPFTNERRAAYRKSLGKLHPAAWSRLVEHCLSEEGPAKMPSAPDLWRIHKRLKAQRASAPVIDKPRDDGWRGDKWDLNANRRLLAHIRTRVGTNSRCYGEVRPFHFLPGEPCWSEQQAHCTEILVRYKKAWSQDMREWVNTETGEIGSPPAQHQGETWIAVMKLAEQDIARYLAKAAA